METRTQRLASHSNRGNRSNSREPLDDRPDTASEQLLTFKRICLPDGKFQCLLIVPVPLLKRENKFVYTEELLRLLIFFSQNQQFAFHYFTD